MKVTLGWQGGAEALFGNVRERSVDLSDVSCVTDDFKATTDGAINSVTDDRKMTSGDVSVSANKTDESKSTEREVWTLRRLLAWLRRDSGFLTGQEELFFSGDSIRNGVMVLVNDTDWELLGELEYQLEPDDNVVFISTLHGG